MGSSSGIPYYHSDMAAAGNSDTWSVIPVPHITPAPVQNIYGGDMMIPVTTPETQLAAWIAVKWFTSPEVQAGWCRVSGYFPTRASAAALLADHLEEDPQWAQALALLPYGAYEPQLVSYQQVREAVSQAFSAIMQGADIRATLDALTAQANQMQAEWMEPH